MRKAIISSSSIKSAPCLRCFAIRIKFILYYRQEQPIDPGVIRYLPSYCNGKEFDMQGAKLKNLEDLMQHKK